LILESMFISCLEMKKLLDSFETVNIN